MIEILGRIACHPNLLHHALGLGIDHGGERDQLREAQDLDGVSHHRQPAFGRQSPIPDLCCQPPADFDAGGECRLKFWNMDSNETDEPLLLPQLRSVECEAMLIEVRFYVVCEPIALLARE